MTPEMTTHRWIALAILANLMTISGCVLAGSMGLCSAKEALGAWGIVLSGQFAIALVAACMQAAKSYVPVSDWPSFVVRSNEPPYEPIFHFEEGTPLR